VTKPTWHDFDLWYVTKLTNVQAIFSQGRIVSADRQDAAYVNVWGKSFLDKRANRRLPVGMGASLASFVQLFATPRPPALYNVVTGVGVETRLQNRDLALFRTSVSRLVDCLVPVVFCDRQPLSGDARFVAAFDGGDIIDWELIRSGDFARRADDQNRVARAGAEILAHREVPIEAIAEVVCWEDDAQIRTWIAAAAVTNVPVLRSQRHFFSRGA
jgi:hypothetical protein